jgi:hypothetical protein
MIEGEEKYTQSFYQNMEAQTELKTWMKLSLLHYDILQAGHIFVFYDSTNIQRLFFEHH